MPNYIQPLSAIGAGAGGTLGAAAGGASGGLLGRLGDIAGVAGDLFDAPRQAAYNVARTGGRLLEGDATWDDALSALPGLGMAGLAMLPGVGLPLAALAGGTAQFLGKKAEDAFAPEGHVNRFQDAGTGALVDALGGDKDSWLQNMAAGAATDPLSFMGAGLGRAAGAAKGAELGGALGGRWEGIANHLGPQYPGGAEKLTGMLTSPRMMERMAQYGGSEAQAGRLGDIADRINNILKNPERDRILGEIPQGSEYLGHGVETLALKTPEGGVVGVKQPSFMTEDAVKDFSQPVPTRPQLDEVLQANRSVPFSGTRGERAANSVRVEHTPMLQTSSYVPEGFNWVDELRKNDPLYAQGRESLLESLANKGIQNTDLHPGNFGRDPSGQFRILDPGGISPMNASGKIPLASDMAMQQGTAPERWLVKNLLGSPQSIRSEIQSGRRGSSLADIIEGSNLSLTSPMSGPATMPIPGQPGLSSRISFPNKDSAFPEILEMAKKQYGNMGNRLPEGMSGQSFYDLILRLKEGGIGTDDVYRLIRGSAHL